MVATLPDEVPESGLSWITVGKNIDISFDQDHTILEFLAQFGVLIT